jgi:hypothetical protein
MTTITVAYYLPTDSRRWIPNGTAEITVPVDCHDPDIDTVAESVCDSIYGEGSFAMICWED